jgi:hypothetical protein
MEAAFCIPKYWKGNLKLILAGKAALCLESDLKVDSSLGRNTNT